MTPLEQKILLGIEQQRSGISAQEQKLAQMQQQPKQIDISPLLAIGDMWAGTNVSAAYKKPDQSVQMQKLAQNLQGQRERLTRDEINLLMMQQQNANRLQSQKFQKELFELKNKGKDLTPGQKKADEAFGKDYQDWVAGGFSNVQGNFGKLTDALTRINDKESELGSTIMPEAIRARFNPESVTIQQDVESVIFQSLKDILGSQFTEKEGQKLAQQSYDPRLSDKENAKKVKRSIETLKNMAAAKQAAVEYFEKNGSLKGFKGMNLKSMDDFNKMLKKQIAGGEKDYGIKVGTIQDGYKYKGGDPSQESSWEAQ